MRENENESRVLHCWKDKSQAAEEEHGWGSEQYWDAVVANCTCFLLDGHAGPHEWTPDSEIVISLPREAKP